MNRNAGLRHGLFSVPITPGAVPEAGAPLRPGSWSQCTVKTRRLSTNPAAHKSSSRSDEMKVPLAFNPQICFSA
jgi:hypothetical protein